MLSRSSRDLLENQFLKVKCGNKFVYTKDSATAHSVLDTYELAEIIRFRDNVYIAIPTESDENQSDCIADAEVDRAHSNSDEVCSFSVGTFGFHSLYYAVEDGELFLSHLEDHRNTNMTQAKTGFIYRYLKDGTLVSQALGFEFVNPSTISNPNVSYHDLIVAFHTAMNRHKPCDQAHILFSGGLDSSILASLAAAHFSEIWLYTCVFSQTSPDLFTSLLSFADLLSKPYGSKYRLVLSIIPSYEIDRVLPLDSFYQFKKSIIDCNISLSLYFAAQLKGRVIKSLSGVLTLLGFESIKNVYEVLNQLDSDFICCQRDWEVKPKNKSADLSSEEHPPVCPSCSRYIANTKCLRKFCKFCCHSVEAGDGSHSCKVHNKSLQNDSDKCTILDKISASVVANYDKLPFIQNLANCKLLMIGSGADEFFGGYARFWTTLRTHGVGAYAKQLLQHQRNLPYRNLMRDSEVIQVVLDENHIPAKVLTVCYPYLDPLVVNFVLSLDKFTICFGESTVDSSTSLDVIPYCEKIILRTLARDYLGLTVAPKLKKRAIQFGSRSSRIDRHRFDLENSD